jgi:uncharacterized protein involved in type VI secretion and phage assembly
MLLRAEASGCIVFVAAGKVEVVKPGKSGSPVLEIEYGNSIVSLEATLDAAGPLADGAVTSRSWSHEQQALATAASSKITVAAPGDFGAAELAKVFRLDELRQQTGALRSKEELTDWSAATQLRAELSAVQGKAEFQGSSKIKPGKLISITGVGTRYDGNAFVTSVHQMVRAGAWQTIAGFGMAAESFASRMPDVASPPAAGLFPPIRGLHLGVVKKVAPDPAGAYRVLVGLPLVDESQGVWARVSEFYASKGFGAVFYPEVDDEVVLGFLDEDPGSPVILGSLHSKPRPPKGKTVPNEKNEIKALVTRSDMEIIFNEKDVIVEIRTPSGQLLRLDDKKDKEVRLEDQFGNRIVMTKEKVDIFSSAELSLRSTKDMTISSGANLSISAKLDYKLEALNIAEKAKASLTIESTGPAKLKAAAPLSVIGAIVNINPPGGG